MVDWKKDVSFRGGKKKEQPAGDASESTSIWKKEIGFGGGKKDKQPKAEKQAKAEKQPRAPKPESDVPFWKKEISFGGGKKKKENAGAPTGEPAVEVELPASVELVNAYVPGVSSEAFLAALARPEPVAAPEPVVGLAPEPAPVTQPAGEQPTTQFPFAVPDPDPVVDVVDLFAASAPSATPNPTPIDLSFPEPAVEAPVVEPVATAAVPVPHPVAPAAPLAPAPSPVVVHPPVPSAELPPLADEQPEKKRKKKEKPAREQGEHVPFYKRELSFGKKKEKAPKPEREPRAEQAAPKDEKPEQAEKSKRTRRSFSISLPKPQPRTGRGAKGGKLPKRIVGLKIGASQIAAATVENDGAAQVMQVARQTLDPGIIANGELREPELLADALKEFFSKNKLPKRGVRLGIATNRIGVRTLEIAGVEDQKQLANAIRFRAQEALPIPIDEAVLDYQVLSESKNEEGETVRKILLVLAYRDLIDRYVAACKKAGIHLVGIDLEAFALLRALAAPREESTAAEAALVAVTVGHDRTTFAVSDGRVCEFTRVLDWGGHTLNVGIARALDLAPSEVDGMKRELSLHGNELPEGLTQEQAQKAREALLKQVQSFARELVSSLQFYQNQPGSLGIGEIVLTGGTAHLGGFAEELQRLIGVRVRVGDPLVRVTLGKKLREPEQLGSLAVAIGLGIEESR